MQQQLLRPSLLRPEELSMESGIDPGQDYYTQDYYNYEHGYDLPQYGSRRKLISSTGMYDEYGEVIMEDDGSYYYSPHESDGEVVRKGRRLAPPPGGVPPPHRPPRQAFGDQNPQLEKPPAERTAKTKSQLKAPIKQRSAPPASFQFPWKNNRIFPEENGGGIDVPKPTTRQQSSSTDNGMVIDGSYFQTKEAMPSAKTRLGKVLNQMNILRALQNSLSSTSGTRDGNACVSRAHVESETESETIPGDSGKSERERGGTNQDVIRQSYTGSATSFTPPPYRHQEGAHMSALDSDKESQTNTETDDTESKTESGTEQDSETETDEASETEDGSESSAESQESSSTKDTEVTIRSSTHSDSDSQTSSASSSSSTHTSYSSRAATERGEDDHNEDMNESVSRISQDSEKTQHNITLRTSSLSSSSDVNKLPPIAENEEDMPSDRSDASDDAPNS